MSVRECFVLVGSSITSVSLAGWDLDCQLINYVSPLDIRIGRANCGPTTTQRPRDFMPRVGGERRAAIPSELVLPVVLSDKPLDKPLCTSIQEVAHLWAAI